MDVTGKSRIIMNIGIISDCNLDYLNKYLNDKYTSKEVYAATAITNIIEGFINANNNVIVFKLYKGEKLSILQGDKLKVYLIPVFRTKLSYIFGCFINAYRIKKCINNNHYPIDILHAHWNYETALGMYFSKSDIPKVCTPRDWTPYIFKILNLKNKICWIQRLVCFYYIYNRKSIHFVANSPYLKNLIENKIHCSITYIPNAVNSIYLSPQRVYYPENPMILSILTSLDSRKNYVVLLQAFKLFRINYPNAILSIIGKPYFDNPFFDKFRKEGLLDNVELLGVKSQKEIKEYLLNSSMLVHPSLEETFGNTLIEAMATKTPVIGGIESGAVPYVLNYGDAGLLCDVRNPIIIKDCMVSLLQPAARDQFVKQGFQRVMRTFSVDSIIASHIELYKSYINENRRK